MASAPDRTIKGTRSRRAKRARTELAHPARALSGTHTNWRDWANHTAGPAGLIVECILADDVATYLRFRAVCVSWRRSTPSPRAHDILDRRFHPRRWIMLPEVFAAQSNRRDFLNVSTGERIRVDHPGLRHQFASTSDGLILLCQNRNGNVRLLNPLTRQTKTLPNATTLLYSPKNQDKSWNSSTGLRDLKELRAFSAGLADSTTLAVHFHDYELTVAKPHAERWSRSAHFMSDAYSALSFGNRFYCFTMEGLMVVDTTNPAQGPRLVMAIKVDDDFVRAYQNIHLVDNDAELILVRRRYGFNNPIKYDVYLVDLDAGKIAPMTGLRGRALFVCNSGAGRGRAVSVHPRLSSSISADTVYEIYCGVHCQPSIDAYDLLRECWIKEYFSARRGSILDHLSRYICRSEDIVVPAPRSHGVVVAVAGPRKRKANTKVIGNEWVN